MDRLQWCCDFYMDASALLTFVDLKVNDIVCHGVIPRLGAETQHDVAHLQKNIQKNTTNPQTQTAVVTHCHAWPPLDGILPFRVDYKIMFFGLYDICNFYAKLFADFPMTWDVVDVNSDTRWTHKNAKAFVFLLLHNVDVMLLSSFLPLLMLEYAARHIVSHWSCLAGEAIESRWL